MTRIFVVAALLAAGLAGVKERHLLQKAHLVGYCKRTTAPAGDAAHWQACRRGKLAGAPDLSRDSCTRVRLAGAAELWRCPAPVGSGPPAGE